MKGIQIIHGPNLNMLGKREPDLYGRLTLADIDERIREKAAELGLSADVFQSNHEGEIIQKIQDIRETHQGLIINPGGYTHTSVAIRDALLLLDIPIVEVHLSNIHRREPFRRRSMTAAAAAGQISGLGFLGYLLAVEYLAFCMKGDSHA